MTLNSNKNKDETHLIVRALRTTQKSGIDTFSFFLPGSKLIDIANISRIKKDVDNIKYRTHKVSLKCMSDITPKVYNEKFRGWGFTYWGN